jgi:hypothetical protein
MYAGTQLRGLIGVTALAVDLGDVIGMRVFLDVGVAVVALKAAMNAGAELVAVDGDAVAGGVLHRFVAVAGQALRLGSQSQRREENDQGEKGQACGSMLPEDAAKIRQPIDWANENCNKKSSDTCGSGHALVFLHGVSLGSPAHGFPAADFPLVPETCAGIATLRRRLL